MSYNVEPNSLGQRTALSNGNNITFLNIECRGAMNRNILMPLLETTVLGNVMKVIPAYNNGTLHLVGDNLSLENTSTDGNVSGEGALLVNVISLDSSIGGLDSKSYGAGETKGLGALDYALAGDEDCVLALVSLFVLIALIVCVGNARHIRKETEGCKDRKKEKVVRFVLFRKRMIYVVSRRGI